MAIRIKTSFAMIILFWVGVFFTPFGLYLIIYGESTRSFDTSTWTLIFGLLCNIITIYYYRKVGWSELGWESAGCLIGFIFIIILSNIYDYFFN